MAKSKLLRNGTRKLRPLGFIKEDRINFKNVETDSHCLTNLETVLVQDTCQFLYCLKSDNRQLFNQMFTKRETLRQVAVANVVAFVNRELIDTQQIVNTVPTLGYTSVSSESMTTDNEVSGVYFTKDRNRKNGNQSHSFRENTITSLVPPAPPNTASAPLSNNKSLMSDRSQQHVSSTSTSQHATQGKLENCLQSVSINNKDSLTNIGYVRTRNKIDEYKSASSESSTETAERGHKGPLILTSDVRVKSNNSSLSSYALCGTALNQPLTKDSSKNIDLLSVRSSLDNKTRFGSVNSDDASKTSSEDATSKSFAQPFIQGNNTEKNIKWDKNQLEISKCCAVDISDSISSYVLYGLSPTVSQSNANSYGYSSLVKNKVSVNETFNHLPSIKRAEFSPPNQNTVSEKNNAATEDIKHTSFDFSEGLKIVSLNQSKGVTLNETGPRGRQQYPKSNTIPTNTDSSEPDKENLNPDGVIGTNMLQPNFSQYFDGLQLIQAPSQFTKNIIAGRKRLRKLARSKSLASRDKFRSPSPIDFDDQKRDIIEDFSLVGQSLPSINLKTWSVPTDINEPKLSLGKRQCVDESSQTNWYELEYLNSKTNTPNKYKGLLSNNNNDGGARFSDDNLGLKYSLFRSTLNSEPDKLNLNKRASSVSDNTDKLKGYSIGKWKPSKEHVMNNNSESVKKGSTLGQTKSSDDITSNGTIESNKILSKNNISNRKALSPNRKLVTSMDSTDHNTDSLNLLKPDGTWQSPWTKAFSNNIPPKLPIKSENLTMRLLLDEVMVTSTESDSPVYQDPVGKVAKEPLYMGCSSQVPDTEAKSKFHYIHGDNTELSGANTKVKVLTALDHDVYSDFQHKKYRDNVTTGNLNTALDKPRMHFIKVRVKEDTSS